MTLTSLCQNALHRRILTWEVRLAIDKLLYHRAYTLQDLQALDALLDALSQGQVGSFPGIPVFKVGDTTPSGQWLIHPPHHRA